MVIMDVKGIAWVGHVYQKFEAMCLEVEEIVYKDTAKYVENQVETVGASVKKFCSDVMQDLIPPTSMDQVKVAAPHFTTVHYDDVGAYKKPKGGTKEEPLKVDLEQLIEEFKVSNKNEVVVGRCYTDYSPQQSLGYSGKKACSRVYNRKCNNWSMHNDSTRGVEKNNEDKDWSPRISDSTNRMEENLDKASPSCAVLNKTHQSLGEEVAILSSPADLSGFDLVEGSDHDIENVSECMPEFSIDNSTSDLSISVKSVGNKRQDLRLSSCSGLSAESNDMRKNIEGVSLVNSFVDPDIQHNEFFEKEVPVPDLGSQFDWHTDAIEMERTDKACLEKSCVLVSGDELHFVPSTEDKHRPYKKKIRDAFSLRMRSARKREYEQLALRYDNDALSSPNSMPTTLLIEDGKSQPKHDINESEWEVL